MRHSYFFYTLEYQAILIHFIISVFLAIFILGASYYLTVKNSDVEKLSAYECGFDPYGNARTPIELKFFLIAMLFLLFDIEALFIFPWVVFEGAPTDLNYWVMFDFLLELYLSFFYAWVLGAFSWE